MKYIGNYKSWIDPKWIEYLLQHDGTKRPSGGENPTCDEFSKAPIVGYDLTKTYWYHYTNHTFPFEVVPPIETQNSMWWFIKMLPGNFMPMHRDPHITQDDKKDCVRYWMPLQDYEPGHLFVYDKQLMVDYKMGDLWAYTDPNELHGASNIGYTPRLTFQFTSYI